MAFGFRRAFVDATEELPSVREIRIALDEMAGSGPAGVSDARLERLSEVVSVDRRTIARWRKWWRDTFTATPFWRMARAGFMLGAS